jgi:hypothetical protein
MIETVEGAGLAARLGGLAIDHVFFGLNDFTISRGGGSIFTALVDGSVEAVREALPDVDFGVGGLTDIRLGSPVPAARILEELERLRCGFTFLRRSYRRDSRLSSPRAIVEGIRAYWEVCSARSPEERARDHAELGKIIASLAR